MGATSVRLQGAWFRSDRTDDARIAAGDAPAIGSAYVPAVTELPIGDALDQQVRAACADGTGDAYPLIANCPIATGFYWTGGAGALGQLTIDRPSAHAEVVHTHGAHRLALGVAGDDVRAVSAARYSGGLIRQRLSPDAFIDYQLVEVGDGPDTCAGTACTFLDRATTTYRTRTVAAFVADTWRPAPRSRSSTACARSRASSAPR
ncbi:MAG: hypothetical protein IPL61_40910 [Myxococcales bacterium]|nr:hypothetical protein [Myxococcales bacterium]